VKRRPADITADRLVNHCERYRDHLSPDEEHLLYDAAILLRRLPARPPRRNTEGDNQ
jgi:hypothetical protein